MKEMKKIQPELEKLKEKYANDKQMLNIKTMELYKEHKVNPLGGCLPLLLQLPILFALFGVFKKWNYPKRFFIFMVKIICARSILCITSFKWSCVILSTKINGICR